MKDQTYASRIERAVTTLETILGRLEGLTGSLTPPDRDPLPIQAPTEGPPCDPEAEALAEKVIRRQLEEQKELAGT